VTVRYLVGDARALLAEVPDGSVDLICTSPPYLSLRSYLPADHPDKALELGSEATPAAFISTLLELTAEFRRVLAPHGSIAIELGDTYAGSGGGGGDYLPGGLRDGQPGFTGSGRKATEQEIKDANAAHWRQKNQRSRDGRGLPDRPAESGRTVETWPLERCLTMVPELYRVALAYGIHPLTGEPSPAGRWRVRNVVVHGRPNPSVGALGDKYRPACSYWAVACVNRRWFDLDAVRTIPSVAPSTYSGNGYTKNNPAGVGRVVLMPGNEAGAPPLDWFEGECDQFESDLWTIPTAPYKGAHYATFAPELVRRFVVSMCPQRVCEICGQPSKRISGEPTYLKANGSEAAPQRWRSGIASGLGAHSLKPDGRFLRQAETIGWTDCGHNAMRPGLVLDPFAGSGTTGMVAAGNGREALLFDLDERCRDLALGRIGLFLDEQDPGRLSVRATGRSGAQ